MHAVAVGQDVVTVFCRSHAIACVNPFIIGRSQALMAHVDSFIEVSYTEFFCYLNCLS